MVYYSFGFSLQKKKKRQCPKCLAPWEGDAGTGQDSVKRSGCEQKLPQTFPGDWDP